MICYHASHEQFAPSRLLTLVQLAEKAGFQAIHSSDHFHPWSKRQGQSGFTFSWIAAAMQATHLPFSMVCAPGQRLHPAIVAQAISTLCEMFPGRFNIELGSGEAINECITGEEWPNKETRNKRLMECYNVIKDLLSGKEVNFSGHVKVSHARLYTLPISQPYIMCAGVSDQTCEWAGKWADGLVTTAGNMEDVRNKIALFRSNGGSAKPVYLQFAFSYADKIDNAQSEAYDQWRSNILPVDKLANLSRVEQFDEAAKTTTRDEVTEVIPAYSSMKTLRDDVERYLTLDIERLILHNITRQQELFISDYGKVIGMV